MSTSKKLCTALIVLAMVLQLFPGLGIPAQAAGAYFMFPAERTTVDGARTTTNERVTLQGTFNNVVPSTISYSVYQIIDPNDKDDPSDDLIGASRTNQTSGILADPVMFTLTVYNIQLFPGLNRITFRGYQGGSEVTDSYYIVYRDSPVLYNLTASIAGNSFPVLENGTTVVYSSASNGRNTYDISISGNAPNAQSVTVIVNGSSKTFSVNPTTSSFVASPITLRKGKNLVTFRVANNSQTIELTREIAFYNGSVTFYDVMIQETDSSGNVISSAALEYRPNFSFDTNNNLRITGRVIVPNA